MASPAQTSEAQPCPAQSSAAQTSEAQAREAQRLAACCELVSEVAHAAGEVTLRLTGTSMLPAIWPGDVVTSQRCRVADLRIGQIVLYRGPGVLTAHRLIRITAHHLVLQGDSRVHPDPPVHLHQLIGPVIAIRRDGRPVRLNRSLRHRVLAFMLRHSELCMRLFLRFANSDSFR